LGYTIVGLFMGYLIFFLIVWKCCRWYIPL